MTISNSEIIHNPATATAAAGSELPNTAGETITPFTPPDLAGLGITECGTVNGKPRFLVDSEAIINLDSGFKHKGLCDGPTFTAGHACGFSCTFCYVESMIFLENKRLQAIANERGLKFEEMVVEIEDAATKVRRFLTTKDGKAKFTDAADNRIIYGSPLVDVAANLPQVNVTVAVCNAILELTHWQIRLLSKSSLLLEVAKQIPEKYKNRIIYGFSTGTFDSDLAALFEKGTGLVSKRLAALKWLQDNGYRTFGMVCPILPQADYKAFAKSVAANIDIANCEHVSAEVINGRGDSLQATVDALRNGRHDAEANLLAGITTDGKAWEESAQRTFEALAEVIPADKLRFLQYVSSKTSSGGWPVRRKVLCCSRRNARPRNRKKQWQPRNE